jgi:DNA polymerase I
MPYNSLLYGSGTTEGIVATEPIRGKENTIQVFYRDGTSEYKVFKPFTYININDPVTSQFYDNTPLTFLKGTNFYNLMIQHESWSFIKWVEKNAQSAYTPFLQSQWMIHSGETQFKGMGFDDPLRLYLDIEVYTADGFDFPNSARDEDQIIMVSLLSNKGHKAVLVNDYDGTTEKIDNVHLYPNEVTLLDRLVKTINKLNPDIIIGHNIFGFDIPYIRDRCQKFGVKFAIGRDGSEPNSFHTSIKFAEKSDEYENFNVYGRHVLDTMFMAKGFDQVARKLDSYGLKYCADFLGGIGTERTYIDGGDIKHAWDNTHNKHTRTDLINYALDDVIETRLLDKNWGGIIFQTSKMFPLPCQDVSRYGTGNKIESLFTRHYYNHLWSYPKADPRESYGGGYTGLFTFGYINEPSIYIDVESLYPTVMAMLEIQPPKDELKLFQTLLNLVREERFKLKDAMKAEKDPQIKSQLNMEQNAMKVILNSFYGMLGFEYGNFNYYKGASDTTEWGRKIARRMNIEAETLGGKVIRTDTDGSLVVVPQEFRANIESELQFIKKVEDKLNEWLQTQL